MLVLHIRSSFNTVGFVMRTLLEGVCLLNWNIWLCWIWKLFLIFHVPHRNTTKEICRIMPEVTVEKLHYYWHLPPKTFLTTTPMQKWLRLGQGSKCFLLIKKLRQYMTVSVYLPNALLMQRLEILFVIHQSQETRRDLSYEAILFSSMIITGDNFHYAKGFAVVWEEGIA